MNPMNKLGQYEFYCPSCDSSYDLRGSVPAFVAGISKGKRIHLIFVLCASCAESYFNLNSDQALEEQKRILRKVFPGFVDRSWSVTDSFTLSLYGGCHIKAMTHGNYLPKFIFDAYNDGVIDISVLPGGYSGSSK